LNGVDPCPGTRMAGSRCGASSASQNPAAVTASAASSASACVRRPTMRSRGARAAANSASAPSMRANSEKAMPPATTAGPFMPGRPRTSIRWPTSNRPIASAAGASSATRTGTRLPMPCQPVENASIVTTTENTSSVVCTSTYQRGFQDTGPAPPSSSQAMEAASSMASSTSLKGGMSGRRRALMPPRFLVVYATSARARARPAAG
jgi:hypothetical protein